MRGAFVGFILVAPRARDKGSWPNTPDSQYRAPCAPPCSGGAAAIKRTVQQYPGTHVKLVPRWWGGLRGGSTALALALDTLELVRRRDCGDRGEHACSCVCVFVVCVASFVAFRQTFSAKQQLASAAS